MSWAADPASESRELGEWLLGAVGIDPPGGLVTLAPGDDLRRVPWARQAEWVVIPETGGIALARLEGAVIEPGANLAGEERDSVKLGSGAVVARAQVDSDLVRLRGALVRAVLMAGALGRIHEMTVSHARERRQFGRPIGSFQAVQTHVVTVAQQAALVDVAVQSALSREGAFEIAAAKLLAGRAALSASRAAHQVHGAVGVTRQHPLGVETRRLWAWRSEWGGERFWAARLGGAAAAAGPDRLYPAITAGSAELLV